jgi:hypothetical protein
VSQLAYQTPGAEPRALPSPRVCWPVRIALVVVVLATAFFRPGDISFLADESYLLHTALRFNHQPAHQYGFDLPFTVCVFNPTVGPRELHYGPAPVWLYQLILAVTTDPISVVEIHALLLASLTALALTWLARSIGVTPWLTVIVMLSPWLWLYHRMLWDNTLCVPLSALALGAYTDFLSTRRASRLYVIVGCLAVMPLVHPMSMALVAPLLAHMALFRGRALWKQKWGLLGVIVVINLLGWPYWNYLLSQASSTPFVQSFSLWKGWIFPFLGAQHLTAAGLDSAILGEEWYFNFPAPITWLVVIAQGISLLAFVAVWVGIILAIIRSKYVLRHPKEAAPIDHVAAIALGVFICQCILDGIGRAYDEPHYFNATWIAYVVFVWLTIDTLVRRVWQRSILVRVMLPMYAAALLIVLLAMIGKIARDGGTITRGYGTVLSEQVAAVRSLRQFSPARPPTLIFPQWQSVPGEMLTLLEMLPAQRGDLPRRLLVVRYRAAYPGDARIVVDDFPPNTP